MEKLPEEETKNSITERRCLLGLDFMGAVFL